MTKFRAILLVGAASAALIVTAGGSSYAAVAPTSAPTGVDFQNDLTGCGARHLPPADPVNG